MALATLPQLRFLHPPRTGGTSIVKALGLEAPEYRGHALPDPHERLSISRNPATIYVLTIRNPWDRMVSLYHHGSGPRWHQMGIHFRNWLLDPLLQERQYGNRFRSLIARPCVHWKVEGCWLAPLEHRDVTPWRLGEMLGREIEPLHENRTPVRGHYSRYYDDETRELVADWFHEDLEAFGYAFEEAA